MTNNKRIEKMKLVNNRSKTSHGRTISKRHSTDEITDGNRRKPKMRNSFRMTIEGASS